MIGHLSRTALLDLAEGVTPETAVPHLSSCAACRDGLATLRALIAQVQAVDVPEPSPLFWDHLSRRVHDAVAAEHANGASGFGWRPRWMMAAVAVVIAGAFALIVDVYTPPNVSGGTPAVPSTGALTRSRDEPGLPVDDLSLEFVADLAGGLSSNDFVEMGIASGSGLLDDLAGDLSARERAELQRLLNEALSAPAGRPS